MKSYVLVTILMVLVLAGCLGGNALVCPAQYEPVCGEDGKNYDNTCFAQKANVSIAHEGRCSVQVKACDDSDGGKDIFSFGSVLIDGHMYDDFCKDPKTVSEYYCQADIKKSEDLPCPAGYVCTDGACEETPCDDSDGGLKPGEKGTVSTASDEATDSCEQNGTLKEYLCEGTNYSFKYVECPTGQECANGACVEYQCTDSDAKDKTKTGTTEYMDQSETDECNDSISVKEYYCENNQIKSEVLKCAVGRICENGRCVEGPACLDSDNGKDKYTAGTVTVDGEDYDDECDSDEEVIEYWCDGDDPKSDLMDCGTDHQCIAGKCVPVECEMDIEAFDEEDVRYQIQSFSSDTIRLYVDDIVELDDDLILELSGVSGTEATFTLYLDYDEYLSGGDECSESIEEGNSSNDLCGENTGDVDVDTVDDTDEYVEVNLDDFKVVEYYTGEGEDVEYFGYACNKDDEKVYAELEILFHPYIDTASGGFNLDGKTFKFFGLTAEILEVDLDDGLFTFELDGEEYELEDGENFDYKDREYEADLYFNDAGLYRAVVQID